MIIEARFYATIADRLLKAAIAELELEGVAFDVVTVPGALEIPLALAGAAARGVIPMSANNGSYAGVVALGCVIRGETAHFDIVCRNANHWLMDVAIRHSIPLGNGVLTVENEKQALARATGGRDSKGAEAARACLRLIEIAQVGRGRVT